MANISATLPSNRTIHKGAFANRLHVPIFILTLITAGAHLYLAAQPDEELRLWFLLNGIGYLALVAAFLLPQFQSIHSIVRWTLFVYTLLTIILWFFLGSPAEGELEQCIDEERPSEDRKSTRLNSSHRCISYAVFCLKKKKKESSQ